MSTTLQLVHAERLQRLVGSDRLTAATIDPEGLNNDVALVDTAHGRFVARMPKSDVAMRELQAEAQMLAWLAPRLHVAIPRPLRVTDDGMFYELLPGRAVAPTALAVAPTTDRERFGREVGTFLASLHSLRVDDAHVPKALVEAITPQRARVAWAAMWADVAEHVHPLLQRHQREVAQRLAAEADQLDFASAVIHGDLASYHLLADDHLRLTAVIDWGECHRGDPARDLGALLHVYGEAFIAELAATYPLDEAALRRARFYAHAAEFAWVLRGITSGEALWFAAHLGAPRDVRLPWAVSMS